MRGGNPAIVGRFVFHCHVVKHGDKGMMQTIEVVEKIEVSELRSLITFPSLIPGRQA